MKYRLHSRNRGSVAVLAFVALVPLLAAIGGIAVDCMHVNDAKGELQRATDAAALAGAEDVSNYLGTKLKTATTVSDGNEEPVNFALAVAALNPVDGPLGLWQSGQRTVTATIRYDANLSGPPNFPNRCDVTGTVAIRSLFSQIFGNFGQTVSTFSSAGLTPLNKLSGWGPMLVSWVDPDPSGKKLKDLSVDDIFTVQIKTNSVWLTNPNPTDEAIINHIWKPADYPGVQLPPISIGDIIQSDNGIKSAGKLFDRLEGHTVVFVVTSDSANNPVLGKGVPKHPVIGFIGLNVISSTTKNPNPSLTGKLVPVAGIGGFDPNGTGNTITTFAPFLVRLIQ